MTTQKALRPRDDVERLYASRKKKRRGLISIEDSVVALIQRLEDYIKKTQRKTDYADQKQYQQHKHQHNKNNQKTKMGRKTTV